jgi:hypothetical protein
MRTRILLPVVCLAIVAGISSAQSPALPPAPIPVPQGGNAPQELATPPQPVPPPGNAPQVLNTPPQAVPGPPGAPQFVPAYTPLPYLPPPEAYPYPPPMPFLVGGPVWNPNLWLGVEGLAWWTKGQPLSVPVLTTGPASQGTLAGNLGVPGTTAIRSPLDYDVSGGVRISGGAWLDLFDLGNVFGFDASVFWLDRQSAGFGVVDPSGAGNLVINEPLAGANFSTQISAPGQATGAAFVSTTSEFGGFDVNFLWNLHRDECWSFTLLGGFRYLWLDETLVVGSNSTFLTTMTFTDTSGNTLVTAPTGSGASVLDFFGTRNQFYGGQVGGRFEGRWGRWYLGAVGKVAIGATHETITAWGNTLVTPVNAAPVPLSGGNFVGPTNAGRYWSDHFAVAPEFQINLGYQLTPHIRALVGYNFLFLSSVARPGNQVDNVYDGVTRPAVPMASSTFWAQGLTFSLQFNY